jgi:hypothetical protein
VGYNSLGSFTNHFTASVGMSPGRFRRVAGNVAFEPPARPAASGGLGGLVAGTVSIPDGFVWARAYLGIFSDPIVQRRPLAAAVLDIPASAQPHPYQLAHVPNGAWFLHAVAVADTTDPEPWTRRTLLVGSRHLGLIRPGAGVTADISLRLRCPTDLPILLALPDLDEEESIEAETAELVAETAATQVVLRARRAAARLTRLRGAARYAVPFRCSIYRSADRRTVSRAPVRSTGVHQPP